MKKAKTKKEKLLEQCTKATFIYLEKGGDLKVAGEYLIALGAWSNTVDTDDSGTQPSPPPPPPPTGGN
jgi:hypothetical protein